MSKSKIMSNIKKGIYYISPFGRIKELEIISETTLPDGKVCYDIKDIGYSIFPKEGVINNGGGCICLGIGILKRVTAIKPAFVKNWEENIEKWVKNIEKYSEYIVEETKKIEVYNLSQNQRVEFLTAELEQIKLKYSQQ